jgi:predicted dehydrogenase
MPLTAQYTSFVSNNIVPRPAHRQWVFQAQMGGHPGFRSGQSLERMTAVLGRDITEICADMAVKVEKRANLDGGPPIISDQVDNLNYLLRFRDGVMGTMHVSTTAWFGTGTRFEIYGTEGMLMLTSGDAAERVKTTGPGEARLGELMLFGARADVEKFMRDPTPPERLQRKFARIPIADRHYVASGVEPGSAQFLVAQTWHAFYGAIMAGKECAPSFGDQLKIHYVWDAAEQSVREERWVPVDYGRLGANAR